MFKACTVSSGQSTQLPPPKANWNQPHTIHLMVFMVYSPIYEWLIFMGFLVYRSISNIPYMDAMGTRFETKKNARPSIMFARCSERNHNLKPMTHASFYPRESGGAAGGIPNWMTNRGRVFDWCDLFGILWAVYRFSTGFTFFLAHIFLLFTRLRLIEQRRN